MTELERARAHLYQCQRALERSRAAFPQTWIHRPDEEESVIAALSWVWQEQEREKAGDLIDDYGVPWVREALWAREAETYERANPRRLLTELALVLDDKGYRKACRAIQKVFYAPA